VSNITETSATITWTVSTQATGQVEYGTSAAYGSLSALEDSFVYSTHVQQLSGLAAGTLYHYRARSRDAAGDTALSADQTFTTSSPIPSILPTPVPTPTTAPMPVPPTPGGRPFVAPVTARTVTVPSSVDATGGSDASAALNAFVASVPDGSVIAFKAGGTYRLDSGIRFANRHNLVFEGNGATLRPTGQTDSHGNSAFALWNWNTDIIIRNITIVGQNSRPGVYNSSTNENRAGVLIYGGSRIELANVTVLNPWSDYVMIGATVTSSGETPADSVWIHDSTMTGSGRMGIAAVTVTHLLIERVTFDLTAWVVLDIEPNSAAEEVGWVTFRDNAIKRGGSNLPGFVSARGGTGAWDAHDITITGNRTDGTLATDIDHIARRRNVVFTNNTAARSAAGPVLHLAHIDGLTVGGNVQPLSSGSLAAITDSTGVVVSP
jgi:hypothetical protein